MKKNWVDVALIAACFCFAAVGVVLLVISIARTQDNTVLLAVSLGSILVANLLNLVVKKRNGKKEK